MTREERERRAVAEHKCPKCGIRDHFRCVKMDGSLYPKRLAHPHPERMALVDADPGGEAGAATDVCSCNRPLQVHTPALHSV